MKNACSDKREVAVVFLFFLVWFLRFLLAYLYFLKFKLFTMTTKSKVLLGILGAAAAGVVIGLLIAPEKGSDIRKRISKTAGDWADSMSHLWTNGKHTAESTVAETKERVGKTSTKVKDSFS